MSISDQNLKRHIIPPILVALMLPHTSAYADFSLDEFLAAYEPRVDVAWEYQDTYLMQCLPCHFPYQPGLLPARSWHKLMAPNALADHFGETITLDDATRDEVLSYLVANAADQSSHRASQKIIASIAKLDTPLRITDVPYLRRKHHQIPDELLQDNKKFKGFSHCSTCHHQAIDGNYEDYTVSIPGYGRWTW